MRRGPAALAALATAVGLFVGGCGVQPTGVNVARSVPFSIPQTTSAPSASPSRSGHSVPLFLFSASNRGYGTMVNQDVAKEPTALDLPGLLAMQPLRDTETGADWTTYVPQGITLKPTNQAHMYYLFSDAELTPLALTQLWCTFDQYWILHPDPNKKVKPSTRFILSDGQDTQWQDCPAGVSYELAAQAPGKPAFSTAPAASPSPNGN